MTNTVKITKVDSLPDTYEHSTIYLVENGDKFDMFVSNKTGTLLQEMNVSKASSSLADAPFLNRIFFTQSCICELDFDYTIHKFKVCFISDDITLPVECTKIAKSAFTYDDVPNTISAPGVKEVDQMAFYRNTIVTGVDLPVCETLQYRAFSGCTHITTFNAPNLTTINNSAMENMEGLTSIDLPELTTAGTSVFSGADHIVTANLPKLQELLGSAFYSCDALAELNINACTSIAKYALRNCKKLVKLVAPSLETIAADAFRGITAGDRVLLTEETNSHIADWAGEADMFSIQNMDQTKQYNTSTSAWESL